MGKSKENRIETVNSILSKFKKNITGIEFYFKELGIFAESIDEETQRKSKGTFEYYFNELLFKSRETYIKKEDLKIKDDFTDKVTIDNLPVEATIDNGVNNKKVQNDIVLAADIDTSDQDSDIKIMTDNISEDQKEALKVLLENLIRSIKKLDLQPSISPKNFEILSNSSFLMLNNYFEYLLADLLSYYYNKFQNSLNKKIFDFTLMEINEYESIEDLIKALISKEVDSMMLKMTFEGLLAHFIAELEIDEEKNIINWDFIKECRERRHLIVHNSSIVNKKYLSRTKNILNQKVGDVLYVDKEYFRKSCKEFYLAGLIISLNCWAKWDKNNIEQAIELIMFESFELLKHKEYELVSRLTHYSQKVEARNESQEDILLRIKFNRLIALKKLGDNTSFKAEMKKIKTGTASPIFKLAFSILSENYTDIINLVKRAKVLGEIDLNKYREWPIFEFIREIEELNTKIENELKIPNE